VPGSTLVMISLLYHNVPWGDHISLFRATQLDQGLTLAKLFQFHNEHQIAFTKLLIAADYRFLHGSNVLPYVATTLTILVICLFYFWVSAKFGTFQSRSQWLVSCGIVAMLYCNGRLFWTITFPILFVHPSTDLFAIIAFFAFSRLPFALTHGLGEGGSPRASAVALSLLLVIAYGAASISSAAGVMIGPAILVVAAVLLFRSEEFTGSVFVRIAALILLASLIIGGGYVGAYHATAAAHGLQPKSLNILSDLRFLLLFVGGAFFRDSDWPISYHANPVLLYSSVALFWGLLIWVAWQLFKRRNVLTSFELFHACVLVFVLLTAATGGLFRADLSSLEAINKKYAPTALLAWASAASLLIHFRPDILFGKPASPWTRPLAICAVAVVLIMPGDVAELRVWQEWEREVKETAAAAASGVYSGPLMRRVSYDPSVGEGIIRQFIKDRAYCYRQTPPPGYALKERYRLVDGSRVPLAAEVTPVELPSGIDAYTAAGISATLTATSFPSLVIEDSDGRVVGYGTVSPVLPPGVPGGNGRAWFAAFRPRAADQTAFLVYEIDGETARMAGEISLPVRPPAPSTPDPSARRLARTPDHTDYALEFFNGVSTPLVKPPVRMRAADEISLTGWAVDRDGAGPVSALEVLIDHTPYPAQPHLTRPDVAAYFKQPKFTYSGFFFKMPAPKVGAGRHELRLRIYVDGGRSYLETPVYPFYID